jgi:lipopolysaccharide export LptBFGC system permease protein LptF
MNENGQPDNEQPEQPSNRASEQPEQPEQQFDNRASEQPEQQFDNRQNKQQFWQGIAWGSIPLVLFLVTTAIVRFSQNYSGITYGIIGLIVSVLAYIIVLIMAIVHLSRSRRRFLGYGLLTMVLVAPIISAIGCVVATPPL